MRNKNDKYFIALALFVAFLIIFVVIKKRSSKDEFITSEIKASIADIQISVSTTGVVEPQNRLEMKPPINGRIEEILVREGEKVKRGQILAWMSSTERAALLDAARAQGEEKVKYWEDVYKATPLISPIDGEVIVRAVEPGQTLTSSNPVIVLSDRLIVSAQFDETDIGRIKVGQKAFITLDAYPSIKIEGTVDHIAYESELVNNVIIYNVDILPHQTPEFLRSGMSANVQVIEKARQDVVIIPLEAIYTEHGKTFVKVKKNARSAPKKREIEIGLRDEKYAEVISGLTAEDIVIIRGQNYIPKKKKTGTNPFMPFRGRRK